MQSAKCIFGLTIPQSSAGESRLQPLVEEGHIAGEEEVGSEINIARQLMTVT